MTSKIITRESSNIIACYLYNRPLLPTTTSTQNNNSTLNINRPLDHFLRTYFTTHKYIGSSQRSSISDKVYNLIRYEHLLSHLIRSRPFDLERPTRWSEQTEKQLNYKLEMLFTSSFYNAVDNLSLPKFLRTSQNKLQFLQYTASLKNSALAS